MLFVLFRMGVDRYALPASAVAEVLPLMTMKALPGAPEGVAGLLDYRGNAVPVIDLSALSLGRPAEQRVSTRVLIVRYPDAHHGERLLGVVAEHATQLLRSAPDDFQPTHVAADTTRYLGGVTRDAHGLIQRVDVRELLTETLRGALWPPEATIAP